MSFKDINLKQYNDYLDTQKKLGKMSGIAEAITSKDLKRYEYLTDKFVTKPTQEFISYETLKQSPLGQILDEGNKLNRLQVEQLEDLSEGIDKLALEKEDEKPFDWLFESPPGYEEVAEHDIENQIQKYITEKQLNTENAADVKTILAILGRKKGGYTRSKKTELVDALSAQQKKYREKLKTLQPSKQQGKGLLKKKMIGKFQFDIPKLRKHNILSLSYPNNRKINHFPNMIVSNEVKKVLLNEKMNKKYQLSPSEKLFLNDLYMKSEHNLSKSKNRLLGGCSPVYFMNKKQMINRMGVILGELSAGNNNENLINELQNIAYNLYKNKHITKNEYSNIMEINII